jgi:serine/threonine protein kinase/tetratricopeptide (TPR) repeat protein
MDQARWLRLKEIVANAMERPPSARTAFVDAACGEDLALAREAHSLLAHDVATGHELDRGAFAALEERDALAGRELGAYRLLEEIGRGGMGTVHLAERVDGAYQQRVAVKVIRRGMDTDQVLRRFRTERQILATLNHPNIARLLDGGALPDGRPYLVMEHVDGQRIDRYCAERDLPIVERLRLFLQVCDAVSFAHQRLVVHRDLKPGNVLVDSTGTPKLLDFGIAKLLASETDAEDAATETQLGPMTPDYASPEQLAGRTVTTATDVWALGVMLYELLAGQRPHRTGERSAGALLEAIRTQDAVRPSAVAPEAWQRRIRGDLDVIALTAIRKEPERRYASVEAMAADVRRHLEGRPVLARSDSWTYRTTRLLARNVVPVTAGLLVAGALITGTLVAMSQARVARAERELAEKRQNDTLRLTNAMLFELYDGVDQGPTRARAMLVDRAFAYLDRLSRESPNDPRLLHELATVYSRLGSLQGGTRGGSGAGAAEGNARASYERALRLREQISRLAPKHPENMRELGALHLELGTVENIAGRTAAALRLHKRGLALLEQVVKEHPDWRSRIQLVRAHFFVAQALGSSDAVANIGRPSEAAPHLEVALRMNAAMMAERPSDLERRLFMVTVYNEHANCMGKLGRTFESDRSQLAAIATIESLVQRFPDSINNKRELAVAYGNRAASVLRTDKKEALRLAQKSLPLYESIVEAMPGDDDALRDLAIGHRNVGKGLTSNGDLERAMPHLRRATELMQLISARNPDSAFLSRQLAFTYLTLSETLLARREVDDAMAEVQKGIQIGERLMARDATNLIALRTLALSYAQAGKIEETRAATSPARWSRARSWYLRGRDAWAQLAKAGEIPSMNVPQVDQVREALQRCEAALAQRGA